MSDEGECQNICCMNEDCHLALMVTPSDSLPQCFAVNCLKDGKNVCVLEASEHSKAYIKPQVSEPKSQTGDEITDPTSVPKINQPTPLDITAESSQAPLPEMTAEEFAVKCQAEMQVGLCRASIPRYSYLNGKCKRFRYGGCGGNDNNYKTEEECMKTCTVKIVPSKDKPVIDNVEFHEACLVPSDPGPCRAAFSMYYFEPKTQSCEMFIFGGCKGNKNRYGSLEECMSKCAGKGEGFEQHGFIRDHLTPAFFMVSALTIMSIVLLVGLVLVWIRRVKPQRLLVRDDRQELLPEEYLPVEDVQKNINC
ncbi:Kunitz-type protease inhibitor 2 [Bagarius yarrelli]|uniref:Kunitz-type protease inhibitor 2 n=1 Tax=Bagarius yarrelli TaxID=175774 RepID=A0A556U6Z2_BAGYA|nr:Kunitz-type protease inhibitor 2 [Bagarius yarrelli]